MGPAVADVSIWYVVGDILRYAGTDASDALPNQVKLVVGSEHKE